MPDFLVEAQKLFDYTRSLRRDFHMHPELGFTEVRTAGIVADELKSLDMEVTTGVAKTGVVALLEGGAPGPVVLLRFDMDALPVTEETGADYASTIPGIMHACGHDGHTAIGLTVAKLLHAHRNQLAGSVKFVFQPAEEGTCGQEIGGNEMMIRKGVLENPKPDIALALHLWNEKPAGWVHIGGGPVMAGAEHFRITITGKGGHAAMPHQTIDPLLAASQVVTALQSIVSRNTDPLGTAVISVAMLHAGDTFNVIPSQAKLEGTIRTFEPSIRDIVLKRFDEIVNGVTGALGCKAEVEVIRLTPALINVDEIAKHIQSSAHRLLPDFDLDTSPYVAMVAEDMAFMLEQVPGCYFFVGSADQARGLNFGHHHPKFDFDEAVLPHAAALMADAVAEYLK